MNRTLSHTLSHFLNSTLQTLGLRPRGPLTERQKIDVLIAQLEALEKARLVRNGRVYDAAVAGKFLRKKWLARKSRVHSARDFITDVASGSSRTEETYMIRFADGHETPCGDYLRAELAQLQGVN